MKSTNKRASIKALGCRLNSYEALEMEGRLKSSGYEIVPFGEKADLGVINTCTVTNEADSKSRNVIRRFIRSNPNAITVVVGCYSQMDSGRLAMIDGIDYIIGNHDKINFLNYIGDCKVEVPIIIRERISRDDFSIGFVGDPVFEQRANLKIQDGCDFMCSFCVIPFSRGRARSRDWYDLKAEVERMVDKGVKEVVLTGVNLGTYNSNDINFLKLIERLGSTSGICRLRISSIEPTTIPYELFEWMEDSDHPLMPYLHVPLQSGCNNILKQMKRKYNLEEMHDFFNQASDSVSNICIGTDLMVGFPGETQEYFQNTCDTFMKFPFSYCHVFTFSERKGTPASKMTNVVPMNERRLRSGHLRRLSASKKMEFYKKQEGKKSKVLFEKVKGGVLTGYSENYTRVMLKESNNKFENEIYNVELSTATPEFIECKLI